MCAVWLTGAPSVRIPAISNIYEPQLARVQWSHPIHTTHCSNTFTNAPENVCISVPVEMLAHTVPPI